MTTTNWHPPRLEASDAQAIAKTLRRMVDDLAELRHFLDGRDRGVQDDPAKNAGDRLNDAERELEAAIRWLT